MPASVPLSGSSIGTRWSVRWPATSKITESHEAATTSSANRRRHSPRNHARVSVGACVDGVAHVGLVDEDLDPPGGGEPVGQAPVGAHVGPLEVDGLEPGVAPAEGVALAVALEDGELGDPVDLAAGLHRVAGQLVEDGAPPVEDLDGVGVGGAVGHGVGPGVGPVEVLGEQLEGRHPAAVDELDLAPGG